MVRWSNLHVTAQQGDFVDTHAQNSQVLTMCVQLLLRGHSSLFAVQVCVVPLDSSFVFCSCSLMPAATASWSIWTADHAHFHIPVPLTAHQNLVVQPTHIHAIRPQLGNWYSVVLRECSRTGYVYWNPSQWWVLYALYDTNDWLIIMHLSCFCLKGARLNLSECINTVQIRINFIRNSIIHTCTLPWAVQIQRQDNSSK